MPCIPRNFDRVMSRTLADIHHHHTSALSSMTFKGICAWADTPGQEKGYLVQMTDDTLVPPYQLKPGQNVTIVSKYSADEKHYGEGSHSLSRPLCCMQFVCLSACFLALTQGCKPENDPAMMNGTSCAGVMALWILTVTNWDPTCPGGEITASVIMSHNLCGLFAHFSIYMRSFAQEFAALCAPQSDIFTVCTGLQTL